MTYSQPSPALVPDWRLDLLGWRPFGSPRAVSLIRNERRSVFGAPPDSTALGAEVVYKKAPRLAHIFGALTEKDGFPKADKKS